MLRLMISSELGEQGACRPGGDWEHVNFFPIDGTGVNIAKRVCEEHCDVQEQCLEFALTNHMDHGVWGGASERARRRLQRQRVPARVAIAEGRLTHDERSERRQQAAMEDTVKLRRELAS